jgi:hypothetical protein
VTLVGHNAPLTFERTAEGLIVTVPQNAAANDISLLLKIS